MACSAWWDSALCRRLARRKFSGRRRERYPSPPFFWEVPTVWVGIRRHAPVLGEQLQPARKEALKLLSGRGANPRPFLPKLPTPPTRRVSRRHAGLPLAALVRAGLTRCLGMPLPGVTPPYRIGSWLCARGCELTGLDSLGMQEGAPTGPYRVFRTHPQPTPSGLRPARHAQTSPPGWLARLRRLIRL